MAKNKMQSKLEEFDKRFDIYFIYREDSMESGVKEWNSKANKSVKKYIQSLLSEFLKDVMGERVKENPFRKTEKMSEKEKLHSEYDFWVGERRGYNTRLDHIKQKAKDDWGIEI